MLEFLILIAVFVTGCLFGAWNERRRKQHGLMRRASDRSRIDDRLRSITQ